MLQSVHCRCEVCVVEKKLRCELETESETIRFQELCRGDPELWPRLGPSALVAHIHALRNTIGSGERSDRLLGALRNSSLDQPEQIFQNILVLAFVPALHATVTAVTAGFPGIARSDVAQEAFAILLGLLRSPDWLNRKSHLAFALARELRRAVFLWAKSELRIGLEPAISPEFETPVPPSALFEDDVTLNHFLYRSFQAGALSKEDLNLLIQFKLEGNSLSLTDDAASNALRQKMKRLITKMRRRAGYTIAKSPPLSRTREKGRHDF